MNHHKAFRILLLALLVFCANNAYAQEGQLDGYTPPPMFEAAPKAPDPIISFPIETKSSDSSVNPAAAPTTAVTPPAAAVTPPAPKKTARKAPPVPPQRPTTLVASEAFIAEQKKLADEKAVTDAAEKAAQEKATLDAKVASQIDITKDPHAPAVEAPPPAPVEDVKAPEPEPVPAPAPVAEKPQEVVKEPPELPPVPTPSPALNQELMGDELANPSVEEIFEALEGKALKTPLPQGPKDPTERMVVIRSSPDSGPSIRIHAKRPSKKKETTHAFFIVFAPGITEITKLGKNNFEKRILPLLNESPDLFLQIQAYATPGSKGKDEAQRVSLARANAIRTFFLEKNIAAARIQIHALGALSSGGTPDRVDLMLIREIDMAKKPVKKKDVQETPAEPEKAGPPLPQKPVEAAPQPAKTP